MLELYEVEIIANPNDDNGIVIYNIYGLGDGIYAEATVNRMTISLDDYVTGGFHITAPEVFHLILKRSSIGYIVLMMVVVC